MPLSPPLPTKSRLRRIRAAMMLVAIGLAVLIGHGLVFERVAVTGTHATVDRPHAIDGSLSRVSRAHAFAHHTRHGGASWRVGDDDDDDDSDDTLAAVYGWGDLVASPDMATFSIPAGVELGVANVGVVQEAAVSAAPRALYEARGPPSRRPSA